MNVVNASFRCIVIFLVSLVSFTRAFNHASFYVPSHMTRRHDSTQLQLHDVTMRLSMTDVAFDTSSKVQSRIDRNFWTWNGHKIYTEVTTSAANAFNKSNKSNLMAAFSLVGKTKTSPKPTVVLIHGFGCSTTYWRATTSALVECGYEVHAIDLLGQGQSSKPGRRDGIEYSINLWAELIDNYVKENISTSKRNDGIVLMGNSLGSLVALSAATMDFVNSSTCVDIEEQRKESTIKGLCLFNCGIGMNSQGLIDLPEFNAVQRFFFKIVFGIFNTVLFGNEPLLKYILTEVVTRDLLRSALLNLYLVSPDRVDDELVESLYKPAKEEGAVEALSQIYTNNPGKTPMSVVQDNADIVAKIPIHCIWGDQDTVTPFEGPVGQFFYEKSKNPNEKVTVDLIAGGHIPFDDNYKESNESMIRWLDSVTLGKSE